MAAALVRDDEVLAAFEKICWVSLGQEPDLLALQGTLHRQLTGKPLPETAVDPSFALEALTAAGVTHIYVSINYQQIVMAEEIKQYEQEVSHFRRLTSRDLVRRQDRVSD